MKSKLTLKSSSMLFFSNVNLLRNTELEVDSDSLSVSDLKNINRYIKCGSIISTEGLLPVPEEVDVSVEAEVTLETPVEVVAEAPVEVAEQVTEEAPVAKVAIETVEEAPVAEVEVEKPAPRKKTTTKKKTA